jgi:hypothetical protein
MNRHPLIQIVSRLILAGLVLLSTLGVGPDGRSRVAAASETTGVLAAPPRQAPSNQAEAERDQAITAAAAVAQRSGQCVLGEQFAACVQAVGRFATQAAASTAVESGTGAALTCSAAPLFVVAGGAYCVWAWADTRKIVRLSEERLQAAQGLVVSGGGSPGNKQPRDRCDPDPKKPWEAVKGIKVYEAYDASNKVIYVGITNNFPRRQAEHRRNGRTNVRQLTLLPPDLTRLEARAVEELLILIHLETAKHDPLAKEDPLENRIYSINFLTDARYAACIRRAAQLLAAIQYHELEDFLRRNPGIL